MKVPPDQIALFPHSGNRGQIMAFDTITPAFDQLFSAVPVVGSVEWRTGQAGAREPESYRTARLAPDVLDRRERHASLHAVRSSSACDAKAIQLVRPSIGCSTGIRRPLNSLHRVRRIAGWLKTEAVASAAPVRLSTSQARHSASEYRALNELKKH